MDSPAIRPARRPHPPPPPVPPLPPPVTLRATAQGELDAFRMSAAVVVHGGGNAADELLLVHRSPALRFFPDYWALPGGVVEPEVDGQPGDPTLGAHLRCALRELFEETGLLGPGLAQHLPPERGAERRELRAALNSLDGGVRGPALGRWRELLDAAEDPLRGLRPACWTTTPDFAPVRYRALYATLEWPAGEVLGEPSAELIGARVAAPGEWWQAWLAGSTKLVPPVVFLLEELAARSGDLTSALANGDRRSRLVDDGALHAVRPFPGIWMAPVRTPTLPPARTTNCYLVGDERRYVIDPATPYPDEQARLIAFLEEFGGDALAGVIVSHHHPDHTGAVAEVAARFDLPVLGHARTLERLPRPVARPVEVDEGVRLELGSHPADPGAAWFLEGWHTPGHDRGHLVFRESHFGHLFAADLVSTLSTIVIEPPEGHLATYLQSLGRVRDADIGAILPAHGPVAPDGRRLVERFLRHRAHREAILVECLRRHGPAAVDVLLPEVYADTPREAHALARGSLRAGLDKLREEGRARLDGDAWSAAD